MIIKQVLTTYTNHSPWHRCLWSCVFYVERNRMSNKLPRSISST